MKGIDVSKWNGSNDFERAKKDGVDFVIIRANYGYNNNFQKNGYDEYFEENYQRVVDARLSVGVYCYNYAQTVEQAREEARRTLKCLNGRKIDIAVFADAEDSYFLKGDNVTDKIIAYLKIIKNAGYKIGVYANLNWFTNYIDLDKIKSELGDVVTWIAHYNSKLFNNNNNHYKGKYDIWQYGSEGYYADGVSNFGGGISYVDMNISYIDFKENSEREEEYMKEIQERYLITGNYSIDTLSWWCSDKNNVGTTEKYIGYVVTITRKWGNYWYSQFLGGWIDSRAFEEVITIPEQKLKIENEGYSIDNLPWSYKFENKYFKHISSSTEQKGKEFSVTARTSEVGGYIYLHELAKWVDNRAFNLSEHKKSELKSNSEIAREVINGDWGNGEERKARLEKAGYNYEEVQKEVNKLV